jgi:hypothetical protein
MLSVLGLQPVKDNAYSNAEGGSASPQTMAYKNAEGAK